ncbi:translocation/assembly module TamB domain-containing protein [Maritimibacter sp. HL-12]|uniref:translocation/assembly module TamB domain-containing protein n=1 Tax=Maritimibacter sp. HL-12 TaxID=1162418 RepID=UPI000A0F3C16|nr:translocation/assembly module TamB domain-containing protein [Maritimibacter sp. HL-12]SMH41786.1 autotransporter secretion inner membrane protein TamB [Maritimibacter sp. HL-12]
MTRFIALLATVLALSALPVTAQETVSDGPGFLENWLEKNLSAAGREVQVRGFAGALSAQATVEEITIADDDGIWFILRDAVLDWTRSALLTGRLEIETLSAREIEIRRMPVAITDGPQAEASDFALPELPVSIKIGQVTAERVDLGEDLLGTPAVVRLEGGGRLDGGAGEARFTIERIDDKEGVLRLDGAYANDTRTLALDLALNEGPGGIAAGLIGLESGGPVDLEISGTGPIDDFDATIALATDGSQRLAGQVALRPGQMPQDIAFQAELSGDPSALLQPETREFFGTDVRLAVDGVRRGNGLTEISAFALDAGAMSLSGDVVLREGGWPLKLNIAGRIARPDGTPVRLPLDTGMRANEVDLAFAYDARSSDDWSGSLRLSGLDRPDISAESVELRGAGSLFPGGADRAPNLSGTVDFAARGLGATDPALEGVLGRDITGQTRFAKAGGTPLRLSALRLEGEDYGVTGALSLGTDLARLDLLARGDITLRADDLARFAPIAGLPLTGQARLDIGGDAALPGGPFDIAIRGDAQDIGIDEPRLDALFDGASRLEVNARRDAEGTRIEHFAIVSEHARAEGAATLKTGASIVDAQLEITNADRLAEGLDGRVALSATARQAGQDWAYDLDASAPGTATAKATGTLRSGRNGIETVSADLRAQIESLRPYSGLAGQNLNGGLTLQTEIEFAPESGDFEASGTAEGRELALGVDFLDDLIGGASDLAFALRREGGIAVLDRLDLTTREVTIAATGRDEGSAPEVTFTARLRDLGLLVTGLDGPAEASGDAVLGGGRWRVAATGTGPGGTTLSVRGDLGADGTDPALGLEGRAPLALANRLIAPQQLAGTASFDLDLNGDYALAALSGQVTTSDARLALPGLRMALDPITGSARIANGRATLDLGAESSSGGRLDVTGPVALSAPFSADLALRLSALGLTDPTLFDTSVSGEVALDGPLTGGGRISGRLALGAVELRVPETGFGASGTLPDLQHLGEPATVRETRRRAGLISQNGGGGARPYALDLTVDAPSQIFLRGRGLDAEFGGSVRIGGTTASVVPQGGFQLVRGRLDLLGNRLVITEGIVTLAGSLDPYLRVVAETQADDTQVRITLEGPASEPDVRFSSSPDLPEDEILARLVFGRGIEQISPFQALKLASAVATLAGQGGAGTVNDLRQGFGLDDLDVTTDAEGNTAVRAGTYINENIYTDVTVGQDGNAEINLNLTITPNISARGSVSGSGDTGLGVYFEKDY